MKTISVKIPEVLDAQVAVLARQQHAKKATVIRQALEAFLDKPGVPKQLSCYDLAKDLAGCFEGPGDLSYNKKYLEGMGR